MDSVTHTLETISGIKIKERIKNKRINLNWSMLILYSYANISRSYKYMNF